MASREHTYEVHLDWTGNIGEGTSGYRSYKRDHELWAGEAPVLLGSSDPAFRGDAGRWNPEQLLVASLAACHKLWYLHLCADAGIVVTAYRDRAEGVLREDEDGGGQFVSVTLRPQIELAPGSDREQALRLHDEAARLCFIARSVNFPVQHRPVVVGNAAATERHS